MKDLERKWENSEEIANYFSLFEKGFDPIVFKRELKKAIDLVTQKQIDAKPQEELTTPVSDSIICDDWVHNERVRQNNDIYCPICGKKLQTK